MISKIKYFIVNKLPFFSNILQFVYSIFRQQMSKVYIKRMLKIKKEIFLEIGSGEKRGINGWATIDVVNKCDIFWDLRKGIPFPENSVAKVYSSHLFEHLSFSEGQNLLSNCMRVLKPGGYFSICVPNAKLYIKAYLSQDSLDESFFRYKPALNHTTKIDYVNYMAYMDGHHKYMFDKENLIYLLKSAGFSTVRSREFDPNLDLEERDFESIYAEAIK
ncbi:MAG: methyltransferase domain-containing protein [Candidatus Moranbacteria bacterium]|nr:methyltransferase domain-containing protein [Candidatus Moranbacteria bacterium]